MTSLTLSLPFKLNIINQTLTLPLSSLITSFTLALLSVIFWSILCAILLIPYLWLIYRHIIMSKTLKSLTWISSLVRSPSSAPPPEYCLENQRPAYPLLTPMTITNPPMP